MNLFPHFLEDPKEYAQAEMLWVQTWSVLVKRLDQKKQWRVPWFENKFANGEPCLDANPIFSAVDLRRRLAVRILQDTPKAEDDRPDLVYWIDKFAKGEPEELDQLVIGCVLTDQTLAQASELMTKWAKNASLDDLARPAKAQRKPRAATPRRRRMSRA
jgi:hypothetical protein